MEKLYLILERVISLLLDQVYLLYRWFLEQTSIVKFIIIASLAFLVFCGGWFLWAFFRYVDYVVAQNIVEEIVRVLPVNRGFAKALLYLVLFVITPLSWAIISRDKEKRMKAFSKAALFSVMLFLVVGFLSRNFLIDPYNPQHAINCFVMDKGKPKLIPLVEGNEFQFDPETGKKCVPVTPEMAVRLNQSQPNKLDVESNPVFFDPNLGTAKIFYSRNLDNSVQLFDGEGFDPDNGAALQPVTPEIVKEWKKIKASWQTQKDAQRVEAERQAKLESDRKTKEEADFKAQKQTEVDRKARAEADRKAQEQVEADRKAKAEFDRKALEQVEADRKAKEEVDRKALEQADAMNKANALALEAAQQAEKQRQEDLAGNNCDRLAGNKYDRARNVSFDPVEHDALRASSAEAIQACREAIQKNPLNLRYQYQLARSLQSGSPDEAYAILVELANKDYAAACDNLGWLLIRKNKESRGIKVFESGTNLGCVECMFSIGELLYQGRHTQQNRNAGFAYLQMAANAGHMEAAGLVQRYSAEMQANQATQQMMGDLVGQVFKKILTPQ